MKTLEVIAQRAVLAAKLMAVAGSGRKNAALLAAAKQLEARADELETARRVDEAEARDAGLTPSRADAGLAARLTKELTRLAAAPEPVGAVLSGIRLEDGLLVETVRAPLGPVGVLAGADPVFLVRAAALTVKAGNAGLCGGNAAIGRTQAVLLDVMRQGLLSAGLPADALQAVSPEEATVLPRLTVLKKVLIAGEAAADAVAGPVSRTVVERPVDHLYAAADADPETVVNLTVNACTACPDGLSLHTLLLHRSLAESVLAPLQKQLVAAHVTLCGDGELCGLVEAEAVQNWRAPAEGRLCVRLVESLNEALALISVFGSGHAAGILTGDYAAIQRFTAAVDAAVIAVNAAPAFGDGDRLGEPVCLGLSAGAERGPVGLLALTTLKRIVTGNGQTR